MKSRMMISILVIALAAAMIGGATMSWFTSQANISGNTFAAGTLIVDLKGVQDSAEAPFTVSNMAPGDPASEYFIEVRNDGSLDMLFRVYVDDDVANNVYTPQGLPDGYGTANLDGVLDVTVTLRPSDYDYSGLTEYSQYGAEDNVIKNGKLSELIGEDQALNNEAAYFGDPSWPLPVGYVAVYKITVSLPTSAGNEYQGTDFSGTLKVDATQARNQVEGSVVY
jgi:predicted ribosomally synthesized peptide with SipW-like signal peptide